MATRADLPPAHAVHCQHCGCQEPDMELFGQCLECGGYYCPDHLAEAHHCVPWPLEDEQDEQGNRALPAALVVECWMMPAAPGVH